MKIYDVWFYFFVRRWLHRTKGCCLCRVEQKKMVEVSGKAIFIFFKSSLNSLAVEEIKKKVSDDPTETQNCDRKWCLPKCTTEIGVIFTLLLLLRKQKTILPLYEVDHSWEKEKSPGTLRIGDSSARTPLSDGGPSHWEETRENDSKGPSQWKTTKDRVSSTNCMRAWLEALQKWQTTRLLSLHLPIASLLFLHMDLSLLPTNESSLLLLTTASLSHQHSLL